jgi:poly(beta-D-mannuronate) lyase
VVERKLKMARHRIKKWVCLLVFGCAFVLSIPGERTDFNGDGQIDFADFLLFARAYQTGDIAFDRNGDGAVGFGDFLSFAQACANPGRDRSATNVAELTAAIQSARPGDRITMKNGIWRDVDLLFIGQGTVEKPITLRAETAGEVVLTGHSRLRIAGQYLVVDGLWFKGGALSSGHVIAFRKDASLVSSHCRLTQCAVTDYNPPLDTTEYKWVSLFGTKNRVDHCYISGKNNDGATMVVWVGDGPNDHQIDHNHFANRPPLGRNGGETLRVGTSGVSMTVSRTVVEHNLFERCDGEIEIISSKSGENIYRHNTFRSSMGTLTLRHGNANRVEGNFFLGEGVANTGGVRIIGEDHRVVNNYFENLQGTGGRSALVLVDGIPESPLGGYFQVKRALVAFNTFVDCREPIEIGNGLGSSGRSLPPDGVVFANNLVRAIGDRPIVTILDASALVKWVGNKVGGAPIGIAEPGIEEAAVVMEKREGLFRPVPGSIAEDGARGDYQMISEDIDGQPRSVALDVGCDEDSDQKILYRPADSLSVGPSWRK